MSTDASYTVTEAPAVTLGRTTYRVEIQDTTFDLDGVERTEQMVWLYGPRGAVYFLRGYLGQDTGLRQVISWKSGSPLRVGGNEVRVHLLGDIIEVA